MAATRVTPQDVSDWLVSAAGLADCRVTGPVSSRQNSRLFYAQCGGTQPMAVKVCLRPDTDDLDTESARQQHETLVRVHRAMGDDAQLSVPRPCLLLAERGLLATEWIAGRTIANVIFSWRCGADRATSLVARAAHWLKSFHAAHGLSAGRLDVDEKLRFLARMETERPIDDPLFRAAIARLRGSAAAACVATLDRSWVHGDFTCDNVMVADGRTLGIDVEVRYENTTVHDLAPFLNHLELRSLHPSGWRRVSALRQLRETFLATYLGKDASGVRLPLMWLRLYMILQGWATARAKPRAALAAWAVNQSYRIVIARLLRQMSGAR